MGDGMDKHGKSNDDEVLAGLEIIYARHVTEREYLCSTWRRQRAFLPEDAFSSPDTGTYSEEEECIDVSPSPSS